MPKFRNIQAVTFDVGGTLIRPWPSVGHVYAEVAAAHGHPGIEHETLNRQFGAAWRAKENFDHSRRAWQELVEKSFAGLVTPAGVGGFFEALYELFASPRAWQLFDDVVPTLEAMRKRPLKLGIISNWDERLRPLLSALKLSPYFELMVISIEAGAAKPAPAIFEQAVAQLGVPAAAVLHAGDSWEEDVLGAREAGLNAVLLDRKQAGKRAESIPSLSRLVDLAGA